MSERAEKMNGSLFFRGEFFNGGVNIFELKRDIERL